MRHANGRLFMHAGQEFGLLVAAVIDQRLVQCAKARGRIAGQIFDVERLDYVDHEVGARPAAFVFDFLRRSGFGRGDGGIGTKRGWTQAGGAWRFRRSRSLSSAWPLSRRGGAGHCYAGQKSTSIKFGSRIFTRHTGLPSLPALLSNLPKNSRVNDLSARW